MQEHLSNHARKALLKGVCDSHLTVDLRGECGPLEFLVLGLEARRNDEPENICPATVSLFFNAFLHLSKGLSAVTEAHRVTGHLELQAEVSAGRVEQLLDWLELKVVGVEG